jgi:hypothetical protein
MSVITHCFVSNLSTQSLKNEEDQLTLTLEAFKKYGNIFDEYDTLKSKRYENILSNKIRDMSSNMEIFESFMKLKYPGTSERILKMLSNINIVQSTKILNCSILSSLRYQMNLPIDHPINDYLRTGFDCTSLSLCQIEELMIKDGRYLYDADNYMFLWLFTTDPETEINDVNNLEGLLFDMSLICTSFKLYEGFDLIINKLNDNNINLLYDTEVSIRYGTFPISTEEKRERIKRYYL